MFKSTYRDLQCWHAQEKQITPFCVANLCLKYCQSLASCFFIIHEFLSSCVQKYQCAHEFQYVRATQLFADIYVIIMVKLVTSKKASNNKRIQVERFVQSKTSQIVNCKIGTIINFFDCLQFYYKKCLVPSLLQFLLLVHVA